VRVAILLLFCAWATTAPIAQTLYKSVGPDGKIVYGDRPPAEGRNEKTMKFESLPSSALPASASSYVEQLRRLQAASPVVTPPSGVVLYSAAWCGYCRGAKAYLASKGIAYQDIDVETKSGMAAFAQAGGRGSIPLLVAGGQRAQGFTPAAYDVFFANRK
jgi:glutaredoxin